MFLELHERTCHKKEPLFMKKRFSLITTVCLLVILAATSALAGNALRSGRKNFERAWSASFFLKEDKANTYYRAAAHAFEEALAQTPPSRTALFASNLAQAGISFYYAGKNDLCISTMDMAFKKDDRLWEAPLFSAMAHARKKAASATQTLLEKYMATSPGQPILSDEVSRQLESLDSTPLSLRTTVAKLEQAYRLQIRNNLKSIGRGSEAPMDLCNGNYWWRQNRTPCYQKQFVDN